MILGDKPLIFEVVLLQVVTFLTIVFKAIRRGVAIHPLLTF
jgi:hypothetical protein